MLTIKWTVGLIRDVIVSGVVNRSPFLSMATLLLLFLGILFAAVQVSAPFIYTLF